MKRRSTQYDSVPKATAKSREWQNIHLKWSKIKHLCKSVCVCGITVWRNTFENLPNCTNRSKMYIHLWSHLVTLSHRSIKLHSQKYTRRVYWIFVSLLHEWSNAMEVILQFHSSLLNKTTLAVVGILAEFNQPNTEYCYIELNY